MERNSDSCVAAVKTTRCVKAKNMYQPVPSILSCVPQETFPSLGINIETRERYVLYFLRALLTGKEGDGCISIKDIGD